MFESVIVVFERSVIMIFVYPSDFVIYRTKDDVLNITFRKLAIETMGAEDNIKERLNALCAVFEKTATPQSVIQSVVYRGKALHFNKEKEKYIGSNIGFTEIAKALYIYDTNFKDCIYLKLSKMGLTESIKQAKMMGDVKRVPTSVEIDKIVDTMLYNWVTMAVQQRVLLNVIKINRQSSEKLRPKLISTGIPIMEIALTNSVLTV